MSHHHSAHSHSHEHPTGKLRLAVSLFLTLGFVGVELFMGLRANSLALLTDAVHNLTDAIALVLSLLAVYWAAKPSHSRKTFGYHRAGILVALANSLVLVFISAGVIYESVNRLDGQRTVEADPIIWVSLAALMVNGLCAWLLSQGSQHDLNLRSTFLHFLGDVLAAFGALAAGIGIRYTGAAWLDPAAAIFISALIIWSAWAIVSESLDILMEATPVDIDLEQMVEKMTAAQGISGIHHLHVWSLSRQRRFLAAHLVVEEMSLGQAERLREEVQQLLRHEFRIQHATLQIEFEPVTCELTLYGAPESIGTHPSPVTADESHSN